MWIEETNVEKCSFETSSPETIRGNVLACTVLSIRGGIGQDFPRQRL